MTFVTPASPQLDPQDDIRDMVAAIGRHWGVLLSFGVISLLLGIAIMVWPNVTVAVVALLLGAWLLISGIFSLVGSFTAEGDTGARVLMGIAGGISIILGVLCFRGILQAVEILALFVGIGWLMQGIFQTIFGVQAKGQAGRGWTIFLGLLSIVAGVVVLVWPAPSLTVLAWISGIWLALLGLITIIGAFRVRSTARELVS